MNDAVKKLCRAGIVSALYVVTTLVVFPVASGAIQFRLSEALTLLPLFFFESVPALFVGCLLSNLITGCAPIDVVLGSLITLVAGLMTYAVGKIFKKTWLKIALGGLFPVLFNALLLPLIWEYCYGAEHVYLIQMALLLLGQTVSVYLAGTPLVLAIKKRIGKIIM